MASPNRPMGTCTNRRWRFSSVSRYDMSISVRNGPGDRALTRMFSPGVDHCQAASRVIDSTAPLEAV